MILVITSDLVLGECVARACGGATGGAGGGAGKTVGEDAGREVRVLGDVFAAVEQIDELAPDLIFLDLLLTGPDGFTFLNEIASYPETSDIPIVIISDLNLAGQDLSIYGVVGALQKDTMTPEMIRGLVEEYDR